MSETPEQAQQRFKDEDKIFAERKASGAWPQRKCEECLTHAREHGCTICCCLKAHHHNGGLCLHCGFDERTTTR